MTAWCGDDHHGRLGLCGIVSAQPQNEVLPTPAPAGARSGAADVRTLAIPPAATLTPPPTPPQVATPTPRPTLPPDATATSTAVATPSNRAVIKFDKGDGTILLHGDYSGFTPGPGQVDIFINAQVDMAPGGFQSVTAAYLDHIPVSITWAR